MLAIEIKHGDKLITTPFSFIASANSILYCGAKPIFADINPQTYCLDPREVKKQLIVNPDAKAILCVHLFGKTCQMDALTELAQERNLVLIEDCAQAFGARYRGVHVGNFGDIGCFSFYATKNLWTFEGGMLTTKQEDLAYRARMIIDHGQSEKYKHEILGYNYRMPQICALIGLTSLKLHKKAILSELGSYGSEQGHYPEVIYNQPLYRKLGITGDCPNAEKIAKKVR